MRRSNSNISIYVYFHFLVMLRTTKYRKIILRKGFCEMISSTKFKDLEFSNLAFNQLRIEENEKNNVHTVSIISLTKVGNFHYSKVLPTPLSRPKILAVSIEAARELGLSLSSFEGQEEYIVGSKIPETAKPIAHCYVGHQFGNLAGQLGDGRAITLGDIKTKEGKIWELQYKGAGKTPYSRFADGRAVLRSSVREFLASEYMHALGIPTTRALTLCVGEDTVPRDIRYDGNVKDEKCAVIIRMAENFIRFGSFQTELKNSVEKYDRTQVNQLMEFCIQHNYAHLLEGRSLRESYVSFLKEVISRTAKLVASWQGVGFCHGVLNTDNMSILGLTIDYGPFGMMEYFDSYHICNSSDDWGRYAFEEQPKVCKWNLGKLIESVGKVLEQEELKEITKYLEEEYEIIYKAELRIIYKKKLGLKLTTPDSEFDELLSSLFELLDTLHLDFTLFFYHLTHSPSFLLPSPCSSSLLLSLLPSKGTPPMTASRFSADYISQVLSSPLLQSQLSMKIGHFPAVFFKKNQKKNLNFKFFENINENDLQNVVWGIFDPWRSKYQNLRQIWGNETGQDAQREMKNINPVFCLRNYLMQEVIEDLEEGRGRDKLELVLKLCKDPFNNQLKEEYPEYYKVPPKWAKELCLSCSS